MAVALLYLRERLHFRLLASRYTVGGRLSRDTWYRVARTAAFSQVSIFFAALGGCIRVEDRIGWTSRNVARVYAQFYALLVLRDAASLAPLHALMHTPRWYHLHKAHHEALGKGTQSMHAFHIDILDLVVENVGAQFLVFLGQ